MSPNGIFPHGKNQWGNHKDGTVGVNPFLSCQRHLLNLNIWQGEGSQDLWDEYFPLRQATQLLCQNRMPSVLLLA